MSDKVIFKFDEVSKQFFGIKAVKGVSLELREGRVLGLVGENGAGKSTLMNIIGGVVPHDSGGMTFRGQDYRPRDPSEASRAGIGFIHQELNLFTNLSIAENIFMELFPRRRGLPLIDRGALARKTRELLSSLEIDFPPFTKVEGLVPGERQLVEIAKALSTDANVIIFDEPTTSLTSKETERLFAIIRKLRSEGRAIVYISHILGDVQNIADDIAILRDGALIATGPKADFPINKMISQMIGRDFESSFPVKHPKAPGAEVLGVESFSQPGIVRDINLSVRGGEIVGVFGLMGSGRTELARMIFGLDSYEEGRVLVKGEPLPPASPALAIRKGIAFITENRREEGLLMNVSIFDNIGLVSLRDFVRRFGGIVDVKRLGGAVDKVGQELKIKAGSYKRQNAKSLSGGNQQKVVIGKWLLARPELLIMDEPTRGIDVGAKFEVYTIMNDLASKGTGILFISSEIEELMGICDRIVVMSRGEIQREFPRGEFSQERIMRSAFRQDDVSAAKGEESV